MSDLNDVKRFLADETGLATISTVQADGRVLSKRCRPGRCKCLTRADPEQVKTDNPSVLDLVRVIRVRAIRAAYRTRG